jgi:hypothetical protein
MKKKLYPLDDPELGLAHACDAAFGRVAQIVSSVRRQYRVPGIPPSERISFVDQAIGEIRANLTSTCSACPLKLNHPSKKCLGEDPFEKITEKRFDLTVPSDGSNAPGNEEFCLLTYAGNTWNLHLMIESFARSVANKITETLYGYRSLSKTIEDYNYSVILELIKNAMVHGNQKNDFLNIFRSVLFSWSCKKFDSGFRLSIKVGDHGDPEYFDEYPPQFPRRGYEEFASFNCLAGARRGLGEIRGCGFTIVPPKGIRDRDTGCVVGKVVEAIGELPTRLGREVHTVDREKSADNSD